MLVLAAEQYRRIPQRPVTPAALQTDGLNLRNFQENRMLFQLEDREVLIN